VNFQYVHLYENSIFETKHSDVETGVMLLSDAFDTLCTGFEIMSLVQKSLRRINIQVLHFGKHECFMLPSNYCVPCRKISRNFKLKDYRSVQIFQNLRATSKF